MDYMFEPFRKYADFQGRARRAEYWQFLLVYLVVYVVLLGLILSGQTSLVIIGGLLLVVGAFAAFVPSLAVMVRRLHDTGRSGWWILLNIIPFGGVVVFIFTCLDGDPGANRFGPDPKGRLAEVFA